MSSEQSSSPSSASGLRASVLAGAVAALAAFAVWWTQTAGHGWGDDFAGYLMQAQAIAHSAMRGELTIGTELLALSDSKYGPPAYPWGYPAMLWLASHVVGWDIASLKVLAVLSNGLLALSVYLLGRRYVSPMGAAVAAALVALQPTVLQSGDALTSDLPGLALGALGLFAADALTSTASARARVGLVLLNAVLATLAFATRSNGAFLAVSMFGAIASAWLLGTPSQRGARVREMVLLTVVTTALFLGYLKGLPDGSLAHAGYLSLSPSTIARRLVETVSSSADLMPFSLLRAVGVFSPVVVLVVYAVIGALALMGAWAHRARALPLVISAVLNFALLLTFPDNGGPRYLFPVLLPIAVLGVAGVARLVSHAGLGLGAPRAADSVGRGLTLSHLALLAVVFVGDALAFPPGRTRVIDGPMTPVADSLFQFIRTSVSDSTPVSFYKPRALRYFTGKRGVAITQAEHLPQASVLVLNRREEDGRWEKTWQVRRDSVEAFGGGVFVRVYENSRFLVYSRRPAP